MKATRVLSGGTPVVAVSGSRVCAHPGCDTILSRYNPHPCCSVHDTIKDETPDPAGCYAICRVCGPVPVRLMAEGKNVCRACRNDQQRRNYRGESVAKWRARPGYIRCTDCGNEKRADPDNFRVDSRRGMDLYKRCRACEAKRTTERRLVNVGSGR